MDDIRRPQNLNLEQWLQIRFDFFVSIFEAEKCISDMTLYRDKSILSSHCHENVQLILQDLTFGRYSAKSDSPGGSGNETVREPLLMSYDLPT